MTGDNDPIVTKQIDIIQPGEVIVLQGEAVTKALVIRKGWAAKFKLLADGRRQIVDILIPGDIITAEEMLHLTWTTSLCSLTEMEICGFDPAAFLAEVDSRALRVLDFAALCIRHIFRLRELVMALGRQSAEARAAGLIVSLRQRLISIDQATMDVMPFPLRQQDIADLLGLTQVHVGRVFRAMQDRGVIELDADKLRILDQGALLRISQS